MGAAHLSLVLLKSVSSVLSPYILVYHWCISGISQYLVTYLPVLIPRVGAHVG